MIDRTVGRRTIGAGEARTATLRRHYAAPPEDVWAACTEPDRLNRWFLQVTGDLHEGGRFALEGLRLDPAIEVGALRVNQVLSLGVVATGFFILFLLDRRRVPR